jgi:hypothetical protein
MPSVQYGWIPAPIADFAPFAQNFSDLLNATPAAYMISPTDAASVATANTAFQDAYLLSKKTSPSTRTSVTVSNTVTTRVAMTMLMRTWGSQIRLNPGVSNFDKTALGLRLPNASPTPVPAPATWPVLGIQGYGPLQIQLKYHDSSTPTLKAKPFGALGGELYVGLAVAPLADPSLCIFQGIFTRNYPTIDFLSGDVGKVATFFARWTTKGSPRGGEETQVGPWSPRAVATIAG